MNKNKILDFIKKNKVAVGAVGSIVAVGILAGIGFGVHKLTSNNNDDNTLAVESNKEDKPHENIESNESTASLNNEQATSDNTENKAEDNKESTENKENISDDKNVSSESEKKDNKNQNKDKSESNKNQNKDKSESSKNVNAGIEISEGKTENKPSTGGTQNTDKTPSHSHSWKAVTKVVHHKEQGHYENVLVKPAWTENVPIYEERARDICNDCNKDLTDLSSKEFKEHGINHIKNGGKGSWRTEWNKVQVGTKKVKHDAVYKKKWVVDKKAYDETITSYKCSCGATK